MSAFLLCPRCGHMGDGERRGVCPACGRWLDAYVSREGRHAAQLERWSVRLPTPHARQLVRG